MVTHQGHLSQQRHPGHLSLLMPPCTRSSKGIVLRGCSHASVVFMRRSHLRVYGKFSACARSCCCAFGNNALQLQSCDSPTGAPLG